MRLGSTDADRLAGAGGAPRTATGSEPRTSSHPASCRSAMEKSAPATRPTVEPSGGCGPVGFRTRGPSTALVALADPADLQVEIDVNESDLPNVFAGQRCRVTPEAFSDHHYTGIVAEMAPEASRQKGTLQIKVQIENPDRFLTPELSAKVEFLKNEGAKP